MALNRIGYVYCKTTQQRVCITPRKIKPLRTIGNAIEGYIEPNSYICSNVRCSFSKILFKKNCNTIIDYLNGVLE